MRYLITFTFSILVGFATAQVGPGGVGEITGPATADVGDVDVYTITGDFESPSWTVSSGASTNFRCLGGDACVRITWNTAGTKTISFLDNGVVTKTKTVTVYAPPPATPTATTTTSAGCQSTTITRTNNPPLGVRWYWQTSPTGTSTSLGYGTSITRTVQGPIYLRARSATITYNWSNSSQTISYPYNAFFPAQASGSNVSRCGTGSVTLNASPGNGGNAVRWYTTSSGGSPVHTGTSYTTSSLSSTTTYYAVSYSTSTTCEAQTRKAITAIINPIPGNATASNAARCGSGTVTISASPGSNGNSIRWYASSSGGSVLHTGTSFTTPSISSNTTYYAASYNTSTGCQSGYRRPVIAYVDTPTHAGSISGVSNQCSSGAQTYSLSGHIGTIERWEYQTKDGSGNWSGWNTITETDNVTSVSPTLNYWSGGQRTYNIRATIKSGVCATLYAYKQTTVDPPTVAGTISGNSTKCGSGTENYTLSGHRGTIERWEYRSNDGGGNWSGWSLITETDDVTSVSPSLSWWSGGTRTYEVRATIKSGSCTAQYADMQTTVDQPSDGGFITGTTEEFGIASGSVSINSYVGDIIRWESQTTGGWQPITHTSATLTYTNIQETTRYRAVVQNGVCSIDYSEEALITILAVPTVDLGVHASVRPNDGTIISTDNSHASYQWLKSNVAISGATSHELEVNEPGVYKVTVTSSGGAIYTTGNAVIGSQLEFDKNAVLTYTYRTATQDNSDPFAFDLNQQSISAKVYDGLGRTTQQISLNGSPQKEDLVVPIEYDKFGRQAKSYLPYVAEVNSVHKANALSANYNLSDHRDYYVNTSSHASDKAFSEVSFEASPLNRTLEQGSPGAQWQLGQNTTTFSYDASDATEVIDWDYSNLLTASKTLFTSGELSKNGITDEDGNQTVEYTDKQGQTILKKSQVDGSTWAETYYIYDVYGQLTVVLPPEATSRLDAEFFGQSAASKDAFLNTWAFLYDYDGRDRMTMKKVPGADSVFMVYDRWDRLVLTQDGNQRTTNSWLFTKYDQLNRPIITGIMTGGTESAERTAVAASTVRFDTLNTSLTNEYSNQSYPTSGIDNYLTVTYYDNYDWDNSSVAYTNPAGLTQHTEVKGLVTGTLTKTGNGSWITSASYYDDRYRVIQTVSTNHLGGTDVVTNHYDFIGQVTKSISMHNYGSDTTEITRTFAYDHAGRLLETWHQLNSEDSVLIAENSYNELGELIEKDLHGETGGVFVQSLDYTYNIRGWLTSMNSSDLSGTDGDLFGIELFYDEVDGSLSNTQLYNGNISAMMWSNHDAAAGLVDERAYKFGYDRLNRLKTASHYQDNVATNKYGVEGLNYDLNGNIESLQRRAQSTTAFMDDLTYTYAGNQLQKVSDAATDTTGFYDGYTGSIDYVYDANGNMVKDRNKGIDSIYYNHLNLPTAVILSASGGSQDSIKYLYDAAGIKLQQQVWKNDTLQKTTDYIGEFIYETDTSGSRALQLIQHEEGRVIPNESEGSYDYQYHLKDHLGNVRMTFSTTPENYTMLATMEYGDEAENFSNYVPYEDLTGTETNSGTHVSRNSNLVNNGLDLNTFLSVNKGDTIRSSAYAYYNNASSSYDLVTSTIASALFTSAFDPNKVAEGVSADQTDFNDAFGAGTIMGGRSQTTTPPPAFINYIFFDSEMNYITAGFKQITTASNGNSVEVVSNDFIPDRDGYVMIYLSNETDGSQLIVSWDDFTVYHAKTNVVSTQDYYPFGLTFNESVRVASTPNTMNTFQDQEYDEETGWVQFKWRNHQPDIGRFFNVDPLAEKYMYWSPYAFSGNMVTAHIELEGLEPVGVTNARLAEARRKKAKKLMDEGKVEEAQALLDHQNKMDGFTTGLLIGIATGGTSGALEALFESATGVPILPGADDLLKFGAKKLAKEAIEEGAEKATKSVDDILENAIPGRKTKGKSTQFDKDGGLDQANKDFDDLNPSDVTDIDGGRMGTLEDGRTVIIRNKSTDGRPTIEIQNGKKKTKIRFNESEG